jgi:N-acyl-D-amino-acid deacylase
VIDRATFQNPRQYSVGIRHVLVNGSPAVREGKLVAKHGNGQWIRGAQP